MRRSKAKQSEPKHNLPTRIDKQRRHIFGIEQIDDRSNGEGQRADDIRACPRFRRHGADLQLHLLAAAQHVGEIFQRFRQVAAGFLLHRQADDEELKVGERYACGRVGERDFERLPELHRIGDMPEFASNRVENLLADKRNRFGRREAGLEAAHDKIDRIGEQFQEIGHAFAGHPTDGHIGKPDARGDFDENCQRRRERGKVTHGRRHGCANQEIAQQIFAHGDPLARARELAAELGRGRHDPLDDLIESRDRRILDVAAQLRDLALGPARNDPGADLGEAAARAPVVRIGRRHEGNQKRRQGDEGAEEDQDREKTDRPEGRRDGKIYQTASSSARSRPKYSAFGVKCGRRPLDLNVPRSMPSWPSPSNS